VDRQGRTWHDNEEAPLLVHLWNEVGRGSVLSLSSIEDKEQDDTTQPQDADGDSNCESKADRPVI